MDIKPGPASSVRPSTFHKDPIHHSNLPENKKRLACKELVSQSDCEIVDRKTLGDIKF